jgi:arabinogalactan endo-1,4-beta-galactosidase
MKIEKYLNEGERFKMQDYWNDPTVRKVPKISQDLEYDIFKAAAFAIELLTNVNFHGAASVLEKYVMKEYAKRK